MAVEKSASLLPKRGGVKVTAVDTREPCHISSRFCPWKVSCSRAPCARSINSDVPTSCVHPHSLCSLSRISSHWSGNSGHKWTRIVVGVSRGTCERGGGGGSGTGCGRGAGAGVVGEGCGLRAAG
jgi:hypothetical protein